MTGSDLTSGSVSGTPGPGRAPARPDAASAARSGRDPESLKLMRACREFEGIFLSILFRAMMKTTGTRDAGPYGTIAEQALGQKLAESGGIGLAKVLFDSLAKSSSETELRG